MHAIDPNSKEWKRYMGDALMAEFVKLPIPMTPEPMDEPIPGSDDLGDA